MIWEALVGVFKALLLPMLHSIADAVPEPPSFAQQGFDALGTVWSYLRLMDTWIPVHLAVIGAGVVLATYAVTLLIGLVKLIASYLTLGGGAT